MGVPRIARVAGLPGVGLALLSVPVVLLARQDCRAEALLTAVSRAQALAPVAAGLSAGALGDGPVRGEYAVTVYRPDGSRLGVPAELDAGVLGAAREGRASIGLGGRVDVVLPAPGPRPGAGLAVRVSVADRVWERAALRIWLPVLVLALGLVLFGAGLADRRARRLVARLRELAEGVERLAGGELSARVSTGGTTEVNRLGLALNRLAVRVERRVDAERVRSANLAHRLRTPLAVLRLGVDALDDRSAATRLRGEVTALNRAVDEVIRGVRWPRGPGSEGVGLSATCDLVSVTRERARFWSPLAEDTGRRITVRASHESVPVRSGRSEVRAALDALLGNVFAHTPAGVSMWLWVRPGSDGGGVVTVEDAGPGFPAAGSGLGRRGRSGAGSTGLGLDIVRRVAEESGGRLRTSTSPAGGALVELALGGPAVVESIGPRPA